MKKNIKELINISRYYGNKEGFVIAGGGNTSYKDKDTLWIKASGTLLADMGENNLAVLSRKKLSVISEKKYSADPMERERQVKTDLYSSMIDVENKNRPSVETSLHNLIQYKFVVHLHPTFVNALMCASKSKEIVQQLFGKEALYIPYTDPGYTLFKKIEGELVEYRREYLQDPQLIFLENHGIFVSADTTEEIKSLYDYVIPAITKNIKQDLTFAGIPLHPRTSKILPAIRMILSDDEPKLLKIRHNKLIQHFSQSNETFRKVAFPFSPDIIVYCGSNYIYVDTSGSDEEIIESVERKIKEFRKVYHYSPKVILIKDIGLIAVEENIGSVKIVLDVYEDLMKISYYSESFGGPRFMTKEQIDFINSWEVENYRRKIARGTMQKRRMENKIVIVTGSAQGFGAGIAEHLFKEGANVVIADVNRKKGERLEKQLNRSAGKNKALFIHANVSDPDSVKIMITQTVQEFGGLDLFISNAGILTAGGLDEMPPEEFERITDVNYSAYFLCTKYASEILINQSKYKPDYYTDIIQINSKSGLKGSKKNFAYAGGKFGGIGLTQSFALELAPYNIKVNAICPGNYFEGPLWADPEKGLFIQYLKAGKVPGPKTIDDVKKFYEQQVPMNRGCTVKDVMTAIYYAIEQKYETGQAIPVTGGQIMLH